MAHHQRLKINKGVGVTIPSPEYPSVPTIMWPRVQIPTDFENRMGF